MVAGRAEDAEAIDDFVANEIGVVAANFAVVVVVVLAAILDVGSQRSGQLLRLIFGDKVHHMIGDQRGEPAHVFARGFQVFGGPDGGGGHDFHFAKVAASFLGTFANEAEAPFDEVWIGKLENDPVADAACGAQSLRAVTSNPHARYVTTRPGKARGDAIKVDGLARIQIAEDADEFFQGFQSGGSLAEDAARAVAAADAKFHAAAGGDVEGGEEA